MDNPNTPQNNTENEDITLRCNRCGKPITPAEAVLTPTGYRCQDCVRQQQKIFDTSKPMDYFLGFVLAAVVTFLGSLIASYIGFFTFLLAPAAGVAVAEVVRFATGKRRSKRLFRLVSVGMALGGLPLVLIGLGSVWIGLQAGAFSLYGLIPLGVQVLYLVLAIPSAYYRLSGLRRR